MYSILVLAPVPKPQIDFLEVASAAVVSLLASQFEVEARLTEAVLAMLSLVKTEVVVLVIEASEAAVVEWVAAIAEMKNKLENPFQTMT